MLNQVPAFIGYYYNICQSFPNNFVVVVFSLQRKPLEYVVHGMGVTRSIVSVVLLVHSLVLITPFLTQMMPGAFGQSLCLPAKE